LRTRLVPTTGPTETAPPPSSTLEVAWSFLRHAQMGVLASNRQGKIIAANPAAARLLGFEAATLEGEDAARVFRAPRGDGHLQPGATAAATEPQEVEVVTKSGDVLPVSLRLLPLEGLDGSLQGTVAVFQDLREQKSREEQWRRRDRLASLGELSAGVAHEIRNPLTGIATSAQILRRRLESGDARGQFVDLILEESARLERIVEGLLQFARPAAPQLSRQSVLPALDKALTLVHELAVRQNVLLHVERAPDVPPIFVDHDQVLQVLLNVLMNALQALAKGGEIRVSLKTARKRAAARSAIGRRAGDRLEPAGEMPLLDVVELRVQDNGPGIPAADLARVFDPFYTTRAQGTGLGLSICQTIIREHGGTITIESVVGQGTAVIIDLPVEKRHGDRRRDPR
jgi:two-component system nitrogen regulation sensor histidine kinase GlnL